MTIGLFTTIHGGLSPCLWSPIWKKPPIPWWERIGPQLRAIPLLGGFVNDSILAKFEGIAVTEIKHEAGPLMEKVATQFEASVNLKQMIEDNIAAFDLERLEAMVNAVAKREFRTIERLGALLGFVIGCVQLAFFWATGAISV